uniref:Uncharacterized protein n=1 Tax=Chromera velia CCMP2878 TaxID=1169474 RepID=A0A0G4IE95_9ALVE|eukprot:Cvel_13670.t1-p1 / transcript=Cvel_13670.t1 / gene=Cvel_13670 / organism=Chromera_velia_CCMP2878 / gene_product=hypothetical protein / transcript_product=hypothetical protein / location=Cvel_scaffold944:5155-5721(-) / protein_length=189 / sequence_SO=supercontig / SO=protein_coding / is_pseudo=false
MKAVAADKVVCFLGALDTDRVLQKMALSAIGEVLEAIADGTPRPPHASDMIAPLVWDLAKRVAACERGAHGGGSFPSRGSYGGNRTPASRWVPETQPPSGGGGQPMGWGGAAAAASTTRPSPFLRQPLSSQVQAGPKCGPCCYLRAKMPGHEGRKTDHAPDECPVKKAAEAKGPNTEESWVWETRLVPS